MAKRQEPPQLNAAVSTGMISSRSEHAELEARIAAWRVGAHIEAQAGWSVGKG
jgi:hypothetical protein